MEDYTTWTDTTLPLTIESDDTTAQTATIIAVGQVLENNIITKTAPFVDGVADISLDPSDTTRADVYDYQLTIEYSDGPVFKFPNPENCDGEECEFPTITICESLPEGTS